MNSIIVGLAVLFLYGAFILGILSFFFLTRVIKIEHDEFPDAWQADGKPHGLPFWFPFNDLSKNPKPGTAPWSIGYRWLLKPPQWAETHEKAAQMLRYFRFSQFCLLFFLFCSFCLLFGQLGQQMIGSWLFPR